MKTHVTASVFKNTGSANQNQVPRGIRGRAGDSHAQAGPPAIAGHAPGDPEWVISTSGNGEGKSPTKTRGNYYKLKRRGLIPPKSALPIQENSSVSPIPHQPRLRVSSERFPVVRVAELLSSLSRPGTGSVPPVPVTVAPATSSGRISVWESNGRAHHRITIEAPVRGHGGPRMSGDAPSGSAAVAGCSFSSDSGGPGPRGPGGPGRDVLGSATSGRERSPDRQREGLDVPGGQVGSQAAPVKHGHYHATPLVDGDYLITPCSGEHDLKHDGRSIEACGSGSWSKAVFPAISKPMRLSVIEGIHGPFFCKSWRCPNCRPYVFRRDFARVTTALESRPTWLFVVTTFSPSSWQSGRTSCWKNAWRANQRLLQRLAREVHGKVEYICTMEQHKSGWPHSNWAIRFDLLDQVEEEDLYELAKKISRWIKDNAPSVGLGHSVYCEVLQGEKRASGYINKLAGEKDTPGPKDASREIAKTSQVPLDAPLGARRIRASRGLLPPLRKGDQGLGVAIIKAPMKG